MHLKEKEQIHFIQCHCGEYVDMRNLQEVFEHQHSDSTIEIDWNYSIRKGEPVAYTKGGQEIKLN